MRILITTAQTPFVRGGAELHAESLQRALTVAGHEADIVSVPFKWYPPARIVEHMLAMRLFDLTEVMGNQVDQVIGLKFPAYLIPHPHKVLWILHQLRDAYDLWDTPMGALHRHPDGLSVRDAVRHADRHLVGEAKAVFANSGNVANRLSSFCGIRATPLYHPPPNAELFYRGPATGDIFFPSRLTQIKRQELVLEALALTSSAVRVRFAGAADHEPYADELKKRTAELGLADRVTWLGAISDEQKREEYADSLAVLYPPRDEDYGYITLEAMLSGKAVVTCQDSGGPLEFVRQRQTGLVAEPTPAGLAAALDEVWESRGAVQDWGAAGRDQYASLGIHWPGVVERLLG